MKKMQYKKDEFVMQKLKHFDLKRKIIYIDETGFNTHIQKLYGYSKNKQPCFRKINAKTKNISVIAAITDEKILGYQPIQGSVTAKDFGSFIVNLINLRKLQDQGLDNFVFLWDNAKIHEAKILQPL